MGEMSTSEQDQTTRAEPSAKPVLGTALAAVGLGVAVLLDVADFAEKLGVSSLMAAAVGGSVFALTAVVVLARWLWRRQLGAAGEHPRTLREPGVIVAVVALVVAMAALAMVVWKLPLATTPPVAPEPSTAQTPPSNPSNPVPPSSSPAAPAPDGLFDDFSETSISPERWSLSGDTNAITIRDEQLHLDATGGRPVEASLDAKLPSTVRQISFDIGLITSNAPSKGAGYAVVVDGIGRQQRIWAGPSGGSTRPVVGYELCRERSSCDGEFSYPGEQTVQFGELVHASVSQESDGLVLEIEGLPRQVIGSGGPIGAFRFYIYADEGSDFTAVIDNVTIRR